MSHKTAKIGLTSLVLALAFGGLLYSTIGESAQYYKHVDEVMIQPDAWYGKPLQIHGYAKNVARKRDTLDYRFEMHNNGQVVMEGTLSADGFHATGMTAKCPSKYEVEGGVGAGPTADLPVNSTY
jgi:cytochrome c-type biogenesis protein CcmE